MRRLLMLAGMLSLVFGAGCEWTGVSEDEAWNDAYSWVDFSGVYRAPDGQSPIVTGTTQTPGSTPVNIAVEEDVGVTSGNLNYNGVLSHTPIVPGTVTIRVGSAFTFTDNGAGGLVQVGNPPGSGGSISYATGVWSVRIVGGGLVPGAVIIANYQYTVGGTTGSINPGNSGTPIYHLTVNQTGNLITIKDSRGTILSGRVTGASVADQPTEPSNVRLVFEVATANNAARMTGAFNGNWSGVGTTGSGVLTSRQIEGAWLERSVQGDVNGVSGPATITPTIIVTPIP